MQVRACRHNGVRGQWLTQLTTIECPHVRAFSTHPGIVLTPMSEGSSLPTMDTRKSLSLNSESCSIADHFHVAKLAAALNLYLASPRAEYLRGRFVTSNWDVAELETHKEEIQSGKMLTVGIHADLGPEGHHW